MAGTWQVYFEDLLLIICKKLWESHEVRVCLTFTVLQVGEGNRGDQTEG